MILNRRRILGFVPHRARCRSGRLRRRDRRASTTRPTRRAMRPTQPARRARVAPASGRRCRAARRPRREWRRRRARKLRRRAQAGCRARRRRGPRRRIGDLFAEFITRFGQAGRGPGGRDRLDEGAPLLRGFEPTFGRGRKREREFADGCERRAVVRAHCAKTLREKDRVAARASVFDEIAQPGDERGLIADIARLDRPFEPVAVSEGADREGRREPDREEEIGGAWRQRTAPPGDDNSPPPCGEGRGGSGNPGRLLLRDDEGVAGFPDPPP